MATVASAGTTFIRAGRRFGIGEAKRVRETLELFAPVRAVSIDLSDAVAIDEESFAVMAQAFVLSPQCRVEVRGPLRYRRRLLREIAAANERSVPSESLAAM